MVVVVVLLVFVAELTDVVVVTEELVIVVVVEEVVVTSARAPNGYCVVARTIERATTSPPTRRRRQSEYFTLKPTTSLGSLTAPSLGPPSRVLRPQVRTRMPYANYNAVIFDDSPAHPSRYGPELATRGQLHSWRYAQLCNFPL
jgi:hypothetical protein